LSFFYKHNHRNFHSQITNISTAESCRGEWGNRTRLIFPLPLHGRSNYKRSKKLTMVGSMCRKLVQKIKSRLICCQGWKGIVFPKRISENSDNCRRHCLHWVFADLVWLKSWIPACLGLSFIKEQFNVD
jgi:hypothetical protein